jgi:hypothetical protein
MLNTKKNYDLFFVVNAYRPETQDLEGVISHLRSIELTTGLKVTGLINNTHMMRSTTLEDVLYGQKLTDEVSKELGIPVKYVSCIPEVAKELPEDLKNKCLTINLIMREDWMS